ncbi:MAG: CoA pyrophosphatase [Dehalococcoidia bacterium]|nr:MAG: CoA pyrophosphatase [Dehalococcoidia bacterium]
MRDHVRDAIRLHEARSMPLDGRRDAAVLLLLHAIDNVEHVLLQIRTSTVEHHRGEISFPGGRRDRVDDTLLDTALRETHEEIGVPPEMVEVFGALDDTDTRASNYRVRPYVGAITPGFDAFLHAEREVSALLHVPLPHLLDSVNHVWKPVEQDGVTVASPAYQFGEHVIWGATARVLTQFLGLIAGASVEGTRP